MPADLDTQMDRLAEALAKLLADYSQKHEQEKAAVGQTAAGMEVRRGGGELPA
jgi:hypothetical protein